MGGDGALAEDAVGLPEGDLQIPSVSEKCPKEPVQVRHEHRSRDALSRHVSQQQEDTAAPLEGIAVVAAGQAERAVVIAETPPIEFQLAVRQQLSLNLSDQVQILLEGPVFLVRKMIQTGAGQGIRQQALGLDRIVADFAEAIGSDFQSLQSGIDLPEQVHQPRIRSVLERAVDAPSPIQQLLPKDVLLVHGFSLLWNLWFPLTRLYAGRRRSVAERRCFPTHVRRL